MYARSTMIRGRPESVDEGIVFCRYEVLAMCQELPGCVGLSMIVDRESGRSITTTAWDSIKSMHASATQMRPCGCPKLRAQPVTCPFVRGRWPGMICRWRWG